MIAIWREPCINKLTVLGSIQGKTREESRGLPGELSTMTAVVEQRNRLQTLSRRFVDQATRFLGQEMDHIADGPLTRATALAGADSVCQKVVSAVPCQ